MSLVQHLREFISQRLTAAAAEIFGVFEKTVLQYEEELERQRRLLDISWKPELKYSSADFPKNHIYEEKKDVPAEQQLCNQERSCSLDWGEAEPPQVKVEQEELCCAQQTGQLAPKEENDTFTVTLTYEESDHSEAEQNTDQLRDQGGSGGVESESTRNTELIAKDPKVTDNSKNMCPLSEGQEAGKTSVKCGVCGKVLKDEYHLKMHLRIHTGVKPYLCNTCGKRFRNLSAFKRHTAIHTGEKRYSCKECGKSFTQSGNLTAHMGTHSGEKRYSCNICEKGFSRSSNLVVHMRTHTGEKPYPCSTCGERFKYAAALKKHIKAHIEDDSFSCGRGSAHEDGPSVQHGDECHPETSTGRKRRPK